MYLLDKRILLCTCNSETSLPNLGFPSDPNAPVFLYSSMRCNSKEFRLLTICVGMIYLLYHKIDIRFRSDSGVSDELAQSGWWKMPQLNWDLTNGASTKPL